ncbi:acetyl-CoA carboxylase biotin carboxylase subunit family protein [Streptomyces caelestis]|uniref:ATP-grasp domain-containing protein n=1 Tax=Streptomyces caelestis TaxID=36816 RepID=UPI0036582A5D
MHSRSGSPRLGVVYDDGAAGPGEIASAARARGAELFLVIDRRSSHVAQLLPGLRGRFELCDVSGLTAAEAARAVAAREPDGLLTFSEHRLAETGELAAALGLTRWHSPETTRRLMDKLLQRRLFAGAGIDTTRCVPVAEPAGIAAAVAEAGLPVVLKPRTGTGSRSVRRADSAEEAERLAADFFRSAPAGAVLLVESLLTGAAEEAGPDWGDYVSVETAVHDGDRRLICVTGKFRLEEPFRERGSFVPHTLRAETAERVRALADAAIGALGVRDGVVHTEIKLTPDGPRVIEVNGRVGGLVVDLLRRGAGYDVVEAALLLALGRPAPGAPEFEQVTYQYALVPPAGAQSLVEVGGLDRLRALPGVDLVDVRGHPGQPLDWRAGAADRLGRLYGRVPDHAALGRLIAAIPEAFRPTFTYTHERGS